MNESQGYIAEEAGAVKWHYEVPEDRASKVNLLTVGGLQVTGNWGAGRWGEQFIAWAPLIKRDKLREEALWEAHAKGESLDAVNARFDAPPTPPCILPEDHEGDCTRDKNDPRYAEAQREHTSSDDESQ